MKKILFAAGVAAATLWTGGVMANPGYGYPQGAARYYAPPTMPHQRSAPQAAPSESPGAVLRRGVDALMEFLEQTPASDRLKIAAFLEEQIAPFFDFAYMAQVAAGPLYRNMNDEQQLKLQGKMKEMFLTALAQRLGQYDGQKVVYLPPRRSRGKVVTLSIAIQGGGPYPAQLDFRLRETDGDWKVFDVAANGSSALAYYRDYFRRATQPQGMMGGPAYGGYR